MVVEYVGAEGMDFLLLTPMEAKLYLLLLNRYGQVVTHDEIWEHVWGYCPAIKVRQNLSQLVKSLRDKLEAAGLRSVTTRHCRGYQIRR